MKGFPGSVKNWAIFGAALVLLFLVFLISMAAGYISLTPAQLLRTIAGSGTERENLILFDFRLPRILITVLAGMSFAVAGGVLQSITKNPLADPGILGIHSGAGVMVVLYISFFSVEPGSFVYILPLFAFLGGMITAAIIYVLSYKRGEGIHPFRLVLNGVGLATAWSGAVLMISIRLERSDYQFMANWLAGNIWGDDWPFVFAFLPWLVLFFLIIFARLQALNLLNVDEQAAIGLGVRVEKERWILLFSAVALASAAVSVTGGISFVGLIAPHMARRLVGPRHQVFLPLSALIGAILLLSADTIGRVILDPKGIPAGVIVAVIGAPYFLYLLSRQK